MNRLVRKPDPQYNDIIGILDVNCRMLRKFDKDAAAGEDRALFPANREHGDRFREQYTMLPGQRLFAVEKMSWYERD